MKRVIIGANGQLGKALQAQYPDAEAVDIDELNISDQASVDSFNWTDVGIVLNAAAYTNVDGAESAEGRLSAWQANATALANLARASERHDFAILHISTDYVFDGTQPEHTETEPFSPLSVYGASKAAGDVVLSSLPKHYIIRTSWVIGDGKNFVRTMLEVGKRGSNPSVVSDQMGRLTFTSELVRAIDHLLTHKAPYGTYNVSNSGEPASWADITRSIYQFAGLKNTVSDITTKEYFAKKPEAAPRPLNSTLDLTKLHQTGFQSKAWQDDLQSYIDKELKK